MIEMSKPVGWRKESQRHALAAKGIETGRKSTASQPSYSAVPKETPKRIEIGGNNWSIKCDPDGSNAVLRMDDHIGWRWDGDESDWDIFLIRMGHSKVRGEFLKHLGESGLDYEAIKKIITDEDFDMESAVYSISGDNLRWHFGETIETEDDLLYEEARSMGMSDAQRREYQDFFYTEADTSDTIDFNAFKKTKYYKDAEKDIRNVFDEADSFSDVFSTLNNEAWNYRNIEAMMEYDSGIVYPEVIRINKLWEKDHPREVLAAKMKNDQAQQKLTE